MNVIGHSADRDQAALVFAEAAADVFVEAFATIVGRRSLVLNTMW